MQKRFFVYILSNRRRGVLYVGSTGDLSRRMSEHKAKMVPGFTSTYGLANLVHAEEYQSIMEAREREHQLKRWRRDWKFKLIEELNPDWKDLSGDIA
jgi:putative endonuclease